MFNKVLILLGLVLFAFSMNHPSASRSQAKDRGIAALPGTVQVLFVGAHPDDEYAAAATIYRITTELGGAVDEFVITSGEGGYKYSTLASRFYGVNLNDETEARRLLPNIRKQELQEAGRILGIREHILLSEEDRKFTTDLVEAETFWNLARVESKLVEQLRKQRYDFVFTWLPSPSSHGSHQLATLLAISAVRKLPPQDRPIILGASIELADLAAQQTGQNALNPKIELSDDPVDAHTYQEIPSRPESRLELSAPVWTFDRETPFGRNQMLSYQHIVSWAIAAHKTQGSFQTRFRMHRYERFRLFADQAPNAIGQTQALFDRLNDRSVGSP